MEEAKKEFYSGFQIDSSGLTGICTTIENHILRGSGKQPASAFKVRLRDGSSQTLPDVASVSGLQNVGKREITQLTYEVSSGEDDTQHSVQIEIREPDFESQSTISYTLIGPDREWIKSTQVDIDDFIDGISRTSVARSMSTARFILPIAALACVLAVTYWQAIDHARVSNQDVENLRRMLKNSTTINDSIVQYAIWDAGRADKSQPPLWTLPIIIVPFAGIFISLKNVNKLFKSYIFYTGGQISVVGQRRLFHNVFWVSIVLAVLIGILVNYVSDLI